MIKIDNQKVFITVDGGGANVLSGPIVVSQYPNISIGGDGTTEHEELNNLEWNLSGHIGDANKVAGFDASGLPVYKDAALRSEANTFTGEQSIPDGIKTDSIKKINGSGLFALQDGGTVWHTTKWFTPTTGSTASSSGTTVTLTGSTQFTSAMVGGKFGFGEDKRVITVYISTSQITVESAFSQDYSGIDETQWFVYAPSYTPFPKSRAGDYQIGRWYDQKGNTIIALDENIVRYNQSGDAAGNNWQIDSNGILLGGTRRLAFSSTTGGVNEVGGTKDIGIRRKAAGQLQIYDGITTTTYRDLVLRSLHSEAGQYQYQATSPTADTVNDTRFRNNAGVLTFERCTVANATKGAGTWVSAIENEFIIGNATDNVTINSSGIRLNGATTVFDDVRFDALSLRQQGSGVSVNYDECTVDFISTSNNLDYMIAAPQMPHARKNGAVIYPHIHWEQNQNAVPNFALQYRYQLSLSEKTTAWTSIKCNTAVQAYSGTTKNMICRPAAGITPPATDDVSDIIQFRIIRDTTDALGLSFGADPYTGTVAVNSFDCHIEMDSFGSFDEYVK